MTEGTQRVSRLQADALWQSVDKHLLFYGREFTREIIAAASGATMRTIDGRSILDLSSGQMCATLGHNHPAVTEAMRRAGETVLHLESTLLAPNVVHLAEELSRLLPPSLSHMQFLSTGAESNEAAIKIAKLVTGGFEIVALGGSWHGSTAGAAAATYAHGRKGYGPTVPGTISIPSPNCFRCPIRHCRRRCDMTCLEVGLAQVDETSVGSLAALIAEPIQSAGGVIVPPEGYFQRVREFCDSRGMLLIFDEAQTGLARTGDMFAFEQTGVVPDILTLSKTLGAGLPLAAVVTSVDIAAVCRDRHFSHYTSHASDPLLAEVGLAVVRTLVAEELAARARTLGGYLKKGLRSLMRRHECIGDIRGRGLLLGVELVGDRTTRQPAHDVMQRVSLRCLRLGLNINRVGGPHAVWRIAPPLTIERPQIDHALQILDAALSEEPRCS